MLINTCLKNVSITLFILCHCIIQLKATVNWLPDPGFVVTTHDIITPAQISGKSSTFSIYTSPTYTAINSLDAKLIFGITSFEVKGSTLSISFKITTFSITNTSYQFKFQLLNQTVFYKLRIDSAVIDTSIPQIHYVYKQVTFTYLNTSIGVRSQNFTIPIKSNFLPGVGKISVHVFMQGYNIFNKNGTFFHLEWRLGGISLTDYILYFRVSDQNMVDFVNFVMIAYDKQISQNLYYKRQIYMVLVSCPNSATTTDCPGTGPWAPPSIFVNTGNMLFGNTFIYVGKHTRMQFILNTTTLNDLTQNYILVGLSRAYLSIFSIAVRQCINSSDYFDPSDLTCKAVCSGTYPYAYTPNMICAKCHYSCRTGFCTEEGIQNCTSCTSYKGRYQNPPGSQFRCDCIAGYFDLGTQTCQECKNYVFGCVACTSFNACTQCRPDMTLVSPTKCVCTDPLDSKTRMGECISLTACINYMNVSGAMQCIECNIKKNFVLQNYTCVCAIGSVLSYGVNGVTICTPTEVCGDGIRTKSELCDDNNLINFDGCDQNCVVEYAFLCFGQFMQTSMCVSELISITYIGTMKIETQTVAELYFSLKPYNERLSQMPILSKYLSSNLEINGYFNSLQLILFRADINSQIIFKYRISYADFINNEMDRDLYFDISDNNHTFTRDNTFKISGQNLILQQSQDYQGYVFINYVIIVLIATSFILALISIFQSERWIGIELIHTIQFCFFYFIMFQDIDKKQINFLRALRYSNGYNKIPIQLDLFQFLEFEIKLYLMNFRKEFLTNFNYSALLIAIPIVMLLIKISLNIYSKLIQKKSLKRANLYTLKGDLKETFIQKLKKFLNLEIIIGKLFITINLLFMNQIIFIFFIEQDQNLTDGQPFDLIFERIYTILILGNVIVSIGILNIAAYKSSKISKIAQENTNILHFVDFKRFSPKYAFIYSIFQALKISLLALLFVNNYTVFLILSLDIVYLFVFIIQMPYQSQQRQSQQSYCYAIHNLHNIWNSIGLITLSILILLKNQDLIANQMTATLMVRFFILTICTVSLIFALLRMFASHRIAQIYKNYLQKNIVKEPEIIFEAQNTSQPLKKRKKIKIQTKMEAKTEQNYTNQISQKVNLKSQIKKLKKPLNKQKQLKSKLAKENTNFKRRFK